MKQTTIHARIDHEAYNAILLLTSFRNGSNTISAFVRKAIDVHIENEMKRLKATI